MDLHVDNPWTAITLIGTVWGAGHTVATIIKTKASKSEMPTDFGLVNLEKIAEKLDKVSDNQGEISKGMAVMQKEIEHIKERMGDSAKRAEQDHMELKKIRNILMPLLTEEIARERKRLGLDAQSDTIMQSG